MNEKTHTPHRILLTGASGAMGKVIGPGLAQRGHFVRGFSRRAAEGFTEMHTGDLTDRDAVLRAAEGVDTLVHLGAYPDRADFIEQLLGPNVIGLHYTLEAAVRQKVRRVILASTIQVVSGAWKKEGPRRVDETHPTNHYALTKVWAEAAGEMYARCHSLSVLAVRICWFVRNPDEARRVDKGGANVYFSAADAIRFYTLAVEADRPAPGEYACVFAASKPADRAVVDLEPARQLIGYEPQDTWPQGLGFEFP